MVTSISHTGRDYTTVGDKEQLTISPENVSEILNTFLLTGGKFQNVWISRVRHNKKRLKNRTLLSAIAEKKIYIECPLYYTIPVETIWREKRS